MDSVSLSLTYKGTQQRQGLEGTSTEAPSLSPHPCLRPVPGSRGGEGHLNWVKNKVDGTGVYILQPEKIRKLASAGDAIKSWEGEVCRGVFYASDWNIKSPRLEPCWVRSAQ